MKFNFEELEKYRVTNGLFKTNKGCEFGAFFVNFRSCTLKVIVDNGEQTSWEHVSVSLKDRCPSWMEMEFIKNMFWDKEDTVIQYHPAASEKVNNHPYCLHLWRPIGKEIPVPPAYLIGVKDG